VLSAVRKIEGKGKLGKRPPHASAGERRVPLCVATARLSSDPTRDLRGRPDGPHSHPLRGNYRSCSSGRAAARYRRLQGTADHQACDATGPTRVRPAGELRHAGWAEFDMEGALWIIPASKTKMRKDHLVPLSRQAIAILDDTRTLTGPDGYVFPSIRSRKRPMSDNTINAGLRRLGYATDEMTAHGFPRHGLDLAQRKRQVAPPMRSRRALAHGDSDKVRAAYHRGAHWKERVAMAQWWSDYLDQLRAGRAKSSTPSSERPRLRCQGLASRKSRFVVHRGTVRFCSCL
jgi:hypothetical protein